MPKSKSRGKQQKITIYTAVVVLVLALGIGGYYALQGRSTSSPPVDPTDFQLERQPSLGSDQAPIKVVEFGDFKCPACKAFHEQVFPKLVLNYVDMNLVEFFFMNFQFLGPDSVTAGIAGECIYHQKEEAFWDYFDVVYENQGPESQIWATPQRLLELVRQAGIEVDEAALKACIDQQRYKADVEADKRIGIAMGVTGTPTIFVNGQKVSSFAYNSVRAAIERALSSDGS